MWDILEEVIARGAATNGRTSPMRRRGAMRPPVPGRRQVQDRPSIPLVPSPARASMRATSAIAAMTSPATTVGWANPRSSSAANRQTRNSGAATSSARSTSARLEQPCPPWHRGGRHPGRSPSPGAVGGRPAPHLRMAARVRPRSRHESSAQFQHVVAVDGEVLEEGTLCSSRPGDDGVHREAPQRYVTSMSRACPRRQGIFTRSIRV